MSSSSCGSVPIRARRASTRSPTLSSAHPAHTGRYSRDRSCSDDVRLDELTDGLGAVAARRATSSSVRPTLDLPQERFHARAQLALVLVRVERVQRMRRQDVLDQSTAAPHVKRRDDRPCRVVLDGYGAGISVVMIYEPGERHDPFVANPVGRVEADDASEIGLWLQSSGARASSWARNGTTSSRWRRGRSARRPKCVSAMRWARRRAL